MRHAKIIFLLLFFSSFNNYSYSQYYSDSSLVIKSYSINPFTQVKIINKYGNIKILKNNVDSVKFEIKIKVSTNDSLKIDNLLDNIDFEFTESSKSIQVSTIYNSQKTGFLPSIKDFQKIPGMENKMNVDYIVYLPSYSKLSLNNKYGDIEIEEISSKLKIELSNGNLICNKINNELDLELQFGNGKINQMKNGNLIFRYVPDFEIKKLNSVEIDSKSSKIKIGESNTLKIKSKRDDFKIMDVTNFYSNLFFTNVTIGKTHKNINLESKHGEIKLNYIGKDIESFFINSSYDNLTVNIKKYINYCLNITETKSEIDYSKKNFNLSQTKDSTNEERSFFNGILYKKSDKELNFILNNSKLILKKD